MERERENGGALLTLYAHGHPYLKYRADDIQETPKKGTIATYGAAPDRTPLPARKQRSAETRNQKPHGRVFHTFYFHLQLHSLSKNCLIYKKPTKFARTSYTHTVHYRIITFHAPHKISHTYRTGACIERTTTLPHIAHSQHPRASHNSSLNIDYPHSTIPARQIPISSINSDPSEQLLFC